jgi:hypothetical protein
MVLDEQVVHSSNGEVLMLEWHNVREGRVGPGADSVERLAQRSCQA